jgi:hypothetical protein
MEFKQQTLDRPSRPEPGPAGHQPTDRLLAFLEAL